MKEKLRIIFGPRKEPAVASLPLPLRGLDRAGAVLTGKKHSWLVNLLSFLVPMLLMGLIWAINGVAPFGNRMILAHDQWHQYYPFYVDLQSRLQGGNSLLYTWTTGMGTNYLPMLAYYLASPLNLPLLILPESLQLPWYTLTVLLKIGFAGLFFRLFLCKLMRRSEPMQLFFSTMYALCAYIMGYYWNAIWLDTVALLPLVVLGTLLLLREHRFILYVIALALSLLCSFYIGYMVCIFVVLVFIFYNIVNWDDLTGFWARLWRIFLFSLIAVGITALLTVPTYLALQHSSSADNTFPAGFTLNLTDQYNLKGIFIGLRQVFGNAAALVKPTSFDETLPNVYCGVISLLLAMVYCCCKRIPLRERICSCILLLILALSFLIRQADYVWHGFHFPNMLPFRYSFLFSFTVLFMAYRAYTQFDRFRWYHTLLILPFVGLFFFCVAGTQGAAQIIATLILLLLGLTGLVLYGFGKLTRNHLTLLLALCLLFEAVASAVSGVSAVNTTSMENYPWRGDDSRAVIRQMQTLEEGNPDPWRAEFSLKYTLNESTFFSIPGVSVFSSTCNSGVSAFLESIGCGASVRGNRYVYQQSDPAVNLLLGIKYLINREGVNADPTHFTELANENGVLLLQNNDYVPMGWVVSRQARQYQPTEDGTVFERIESIYGGLLDQRLSLYETLLPAALRYEGSASARSSAGLRYEFRSDGADEDRMAIDFTAPHDGGMSVFSQGRDVGNVYLYVNDQYRCYYDDKYGAIWYVDGLHTGDIVSLRYRTATGKTVGSVTAYGAMFREADFQTMRDTLSQNSMRITARTDTTLEGTVNAREDALLFTTIPYDEGWTVTVDGKPVRTQAMGGAFLAVSLTMGRHTISMHYTPPGWNVSLVISIVSLVLFLLCVVVYLIYRLTHPPIPVVQAHMADAPGEAEPPEQSSAPQMPPVETHVPPTEDGTKAFFLPSSLERSGTGKMPKLVPDGEAAADPSTEDAEFQWPVRSQAAPAPDDPAPFPADDTAEDDFSIPDEWLQ